MSGIDLTEAVDAAAQRLAAAAWDDLNVMEKHAMRETVTPLVAAAAPMIVTQALAPIEALADELDADASKANFTTSTCAGPNCGACTSARDASRLHAALATLSDTTGEATR